ncbi:MAG: response regulator, partial [Rhodospirillales bacterium]
MDTKKFNFGDVRILIAAPDRVTMESLKTLLRNTGFSSMGSVKNLGDIKAALAEENPDLMICEWPFPEGDPGGLIHALRHHEVGSNPFLPVIIVTGDPTPDLVGKVIDSGADDLIIKPLSSAVLLERIEGLVRARKPFIVTSDYIGPERRKNKHPDALEIPLIEVPNTLREKASGQTTSGSLQDFIDATVVKVNLEKLKRYALQIGVLVEMILPAYEANRIDDKLAEDLGRLHYIAEDTGRRLVGTPYDHVSELCESLIKVTGDIRAAMKSPERKDL